MFNKKLLATAVASLTIQPIFLSLNTNAEELEPLSDDIVVTATLGRHNSTTSPAFTSVITAEDIAKSSINSLPDLLRESVGVNNYSDNNGRDELQLRGLGGQYTLVLVNGKRVSSSGALWRGGDFDYSSIPLGSIERVEIVRGPMSSLYGADAIGGVINIITKKADETWKTTVSGEYRSIESGEGGAQYRVGLSTSGALNDSFKLAISGEQYEHDAWYGDKKGADVVPELEHKKAQNLISTLTWTPSENQSVDFDLGYNNDKRPFALYATDPAYREQEITRIDFGVTHSAKWDWGTTTAYIKQENSDIDDFNSRYNAPQNRNLKEENTYAKAYFNTELGSSNSLIAGVDYRHQEIKDAATYLQSGEFSADQTALFAQDEIALAKRLSLTLGARLDHHQVFGDHTSPKAYLVYQATDSLTFKGGANKAFKAPDGSKLSSEYSVISCGGKCYLAGNPDLKPESSTSYEGGFEFKRPGWNLSVSAFKNDISDLIEREIGYDLNNDPISAKWINIAEATTKGIEVQGAYKISSTVSLKGNYTYLDTEYTNIDGQTTVLEYRPKDKATLSLNWQITPKFSTDLTVNYLAGMQYFSWVFNGTDWVQAFPTLDSYFRTDLTFAYAATDALTVRFGAKNVEDIHLDDVDKNYTTHELGRNYYLSASYSF
ncbi:MAG: TonB-dependent receptor [Gammaproteobacteria bacterium]|nr:MAG: TonB-dependent receptor [Gammaproteobacteria bacterium]